MFPQCYVIIRVYQSGLDLKGVLSFRFMYNLGWLPKIQVVPGKNICISIQTLCCLSFYSENKFPQTSSVFVSGSSKLVHKSGTTKTKAETSGSVSTKFFENLRIRGT